MWFRAVFITALMLTLAGTSGAFKRTSVGEAVKDFTLETADGQSVRLSENLGRKATVVVFWAAWSPRSGEALTDYQELYDAYGPEDLKVLAVDVEHQAWEAGELERLVSYARELEIEFPVLFDRNLAVFDEYGVIAVPSTVLVDSEGRVVELLEGYSNMTRGAFRDRVLEVLGVLRPEPFEEETAVGYVPQGKAARYMQMGGMFLKKKMERRAVKALRQAVKEDPNYAEAYWRLAEALESGGWTDEAAEIRARAASLGSAPRNEELPENDASVGGASPSDDAGRPGDDGTGDGAEAHWSGGAGGGSDTTEESAKE